MTNAPLVTLEGIDKTGKTIHHEILKTEITRANFVRHPPEKEPWDTMFENGVTHDIPSIVDSFLLMASRIHNIQAEIVPSLEEGVPVIADRFSDTALAYQPVFREEYFDNISDSKLFFRRLHELCVAEGIIIEPDITILITISREELGRRLEATPDSAITEYEEDIDKLMNVQEIYLDYADEYDRYVVIEDSGEGVMRVYEEIEKILVSEGVLDPKRG